MCLVHKDENIKLQKKRRLRIDVQRCRANGRLLHGQRRVFDATIQGLCQQMVSIGAERERTSRVRR